MPTRRRLSKEEKEKLEQQKKALKKSFQKDLAGTKRVGSKRISDTYKWIAVSTVGVVIVILISVVFLSIPQPYCYYTEGDYIYSTLDQDTETLNFDYILAWYRVRPRATTISCNIVDYYNSSYDVELPPSSSQLVPLTYATDQIWYEIVELASALTFESKLENGTALAMATWVNSTTIEATPSSISRNVRTLVNFKIKLQTKNTLDSYNISLKFDNTQENTTIEYASISSGTYNPATFTFSTQGLSLSAGSNITLDFNIYINTSLPWAELNLLELGTAHLIIEDQLLKDFADGSAFKVSSIDFIPFGTTEDPTLVKSTFLDVIIDVPYFNVSLS